MDALEASCSSRNLLADVPSEGRTGGESGYENHSLRSDGSNTPRATLLNSQTISLRNVSATIKLNSAFPRTDSSAIIQSSWIQRLKPFYQSSTPSEEPANLSNTKENPICTHFTKDFSSCSKRLHKPSHHTRSSSWPPRTLQLQDVEHSLKEFGGSVDVTEGHGKLVVKSCKMVNQSIYVNSSHIDPPNTEVPSTNITNSSDAGSRTGNLFAQQQSSVKQVPVVEGFVPRRLNKEDSTLKRLNDHLESKSGDDSKLKECLAQQKQNPGEDVNKLKSTGECNVPLQMKGLLQAEETCKILDSYQGSRGVSQGDIHALALPNTASRAAYKSGASADEDDKMFLSKPLNCGMENKMLPGQASCIRPDSEIAFSEAVPSGTRVNVDKAGEEEQECAQTGMSKDAGILGFPWAGSNFKQFNESAAKPYMLNDLSYVGASSKFQLSRRTSHLSEAWDKTTERKVMTTCVVGSRIVAASSLSKKDAPNKSDTLCTRATNLADLQKRDFPEGGQQTSRLTLSVRSLHEDAARSRIRDISLGEYWNSWARLLEEPYDMKHAEAASPSARLQQECTVGEHHTTFPPLPSRRTGLDARQKFEANWSCSPHKHTNKDAEGFGFCDLSQQKLALSSKKTDKVLDSRASSLQTKTGGDQGCCAAADQTSQFRLGLQESLKSDLCLYRGATDRVDSQLHNEDYGLRGKVLDNDSSHSRIHSAHPAQECCNNKKSDMGSSTHHAWIQRWQSSAKFSAVAGKAARTSSSDQLKKSCSSNAQCLVLFSQEATGPCDHNLTDFGRGSNRYMEVCATRLDTGSARTASGPRLAVRNFAAFRSGYRGSYVEATTTVGKSRSKVPPTSSQN